MDSQNQSFIADKLHTLLTASPEKFAEIRKSTGRQRDNLMVGFINDTINIEIKDLSVNELRIMAQSL